MTPPDPDSQTEELKHQETTFVIQLRPTRHALSIETDSTATSWFPGLNPRVDEIGRFAGSTDFELIAYRMTYIPGRRFDDLQPRYSALLESEVLSKYHNLLNDLADFYARAWTKGTRLAARRDHSRCDGRIGSSLA